MLSDGVLVANSVVSRIRGGKVCRLTDEEGWPK